MTPNRALPRFKRVATIAFTMTLFLLAACTPDYPLRPPKLEHSPAYPTPEDR